MNATVPLDFPARPDPRPGWFSIVRPREHGSWSLVLEPLVLGLAVAPSLPGLALAVATLAGFFARRPLRLWREAGGTAGPAADALLVCLEAGAGALVIALLLGGAPVLAWLLPPAAFGALFVVYDLRRDSRAAVAEVAGAAAFAFLPAALARLAGFSTASSLALAALCLVRHVPTVLFVRARLRTSKMGEACGTGALLAAGIAFLGTAALVRVGLAPLSAGVLAVMLLARAVVMLGPAGACLPAKVIGMIEGGIGLIFVVVLALGWTRP
jgi:hypothetical protein